MAEDLEARLARIEARLEAIERRLGPVWVSAPRPPASAPPDPYRQASTASNEEIEQLLGARWLPRIGALALIAGLAVLIGLGLQRGVITPAMVAVGIALLCAISIVSGNLLRHEREQFGDVLVGLGLGGLYVDAVGSHLFQKLISAEAMVASCLGLGLLTVGYGAWRARPAFVTFGLAGALGAALMPLQRLDFATSSPLLLLAAIPSFIVATLRRWRSVLAAVWIGSASAAVPGLFAHDLTVIWRLLPFDTFLLLALGGYLAIDAPNLRYDPNNLFPLAAVSIASLTLIGTRVEPRAAHLAGLGVVIASAGLAFRRRSMGQAILLAGATMALLWAPLGLQFGSAAIVLACLAIATSLVQRTRKEVLWPLAVAQLAFAFGSYLRIMGSDIGISAEREGWLLAFFAGAATVTAWGISRAEARTGAAITVWVLATRFAMVALPLPGSAAITLVWSTLFAVLLALGFAFRRPELRHVGLAVAAATLGKIVLLDLASLDAAFRAVLLLVLGALLLAGGYAYVRAGRSTR